MAFWKNSNEDGIKRPVVCALSLLVVVAWVSWAIVGCVERTGEKRGREMDFGCGIARGGQAVKAVNWACCGG